MLIRIEMLQPIGIEARGAADDSVNLVAFFQKKFGAMTWDQHDVGFPVGQLTDKSRLAR